MTRYGRFLAEELLAWLPRVLPITSRPELRAVGGDLVACHFAEELPAVAAGEDAAEAPALTRRLAVLAAARAAAAAETGQRQE